jgi:linoleoyl-CoA desaturase
MKKLKFSKDNGSLFYNELIEETNRYFKERNLPKTGNTLFIFKMVFYFTLVVVFYALMMSSKTETSFLVFYLLMGLAVLLTAFNVSHDASHGVAVKSKYWNKVLFSISFNLQGNNAYIWGKNHTESHHLYTNVEGSDIDVLNNPALRMTRNQELKWYHRFQYLYVPFLSLLYSLNWFFVREFLMMFRVSSRTIKLSMPVVEVVKLIFFKLAYVGYMLLLPILLIPEIDWSTVVLAFILNHFMVSIIFTSVLGVSHLSDYVQHPEPDEEGRLAMSWPMLQMMTSVDYHPESKFLNWTLGGFNAHALHHLLPNMCHVHYLKILPIFRRLANKHGIPYMEMSYAESLASYFRFLYKMGRKMDFTAIPYEGKAS